MATCMNVYRYYIPLIRDSCGTYHIYILGSDCVRLWPHVCAKICLHKSSALRLNNVCVEIVCEHNALIAMRHALVSVQPQSTYSALLYCYLCILVQTHCTRRSGSTNLYPLEDRRRASTINLRPASRPDTRRRQQRKQMGKKRAGSDPTTGLSLARCRLPSASASSRRPSPDLTCPSRPAASP